MNHKSTEYSIEEFLRRFTLDDYIIEIDDMLMKL